MNVYLNELFLDVSHSDDWTVSFDNAISCLKVLSKVDIPLDSISTIIHLQIFLTIAIPPNTKFTDLLNRDKERKKAFLAIYKTAIRELRWVDPIMIKSLMCALMIPRRFYQTAPCLYRQNTETERLVCIGGLVGKMNSGVWTVSIKETPYIWRSLVSHRESKSQ